jgi:CheY-specific phosphatase CheX
MVEMELTIDQRKTKIEELAGDDIAVAVNLNVSKKGIKIDDSMPCVVYGNKVNIQ